jgi:MFS family permease
MRAPLRPPAGMTGFTIIWFGQLVSLTGSAMTRFALALWAWQETGLATALALVIFFSVTPTVLLSPIAGALVDRWNRKLVMMLTDLAAGLSTVVLLLLYATGNLELWHLYAAGAFAGAFEAFQFPAFSAAISTMLPKEQYGRANGMLSLAQSLSQVGAPLLAGFCISFIGIGGVMVLDIVTFLVALATLAWVVVPAPVRTATGSESRGSLWRESLYGFGYIWRRPGLLGLQLVFFGINLIGSIYIGLISPLILARTGSNEEVLGIVLAAHGLGGVAGGLLMSAWGGPRRRVHGVLLGMAGVCLLGIVPLGVGQVLAVWIAAAFFEVFFIPIINGSNQAIWQAKVDPDVQGRVFATRRMIGQLTIPLGYAFVGPLADFVFEPAMESGGTLAPLFGPLVGTGAGAGMGLMLLLAGLLGALVALGGYLFPAVREVETRLPDHSPAATPAATEDAQAT